MSDTNPVSNDIGGYVAGNVVQGRVVTIAAPASRPIAVAGLPAQAVFVGREHELARLVDALKPAAADTRPAVLVWSVGGLPGVGKTALAVRAAHEAVAAGWFPGGVVMANLRGYDQPGQQVSASTALVGLLGALGVPSEHIPSELENRARLWRSLLTERAVNGQPMLIIADNVSDPDQVRPLLPGATAHRVLITSRHRLAGLDGTRLLDLDVLDPVESARMLSAVIRMSDPADTRTQSDPQSTDRVARLCGGLPLAVRVSAALLVAEPEQTMAELADALADGRRRLAELRYDGGLSVRAAFDLSYDHLDPAQARLFRLMALHPGPDMGIGAIAAVAGIDETEARRLLRQLRRAHLVLPGSSADRWRMHDLLRLHGAEKAAADPDRDQATVRLFEHYLGHVRAYDHRGALVAGANTGPSGRAERLAWLDAEHVNLVAMVTFANDYGYPRYAVDLARGLYNYFELRKHWSEWISTHEIALENAVRIGDRTAEGTLLVYLGVAHMQSMRLDVAKALYRRALSIFRAVGDRVGFGSALNDLGLVLRNLGRPHFAMLCHRWALRLFQEAGRGHLEGSALHNIAVGHRLLGRLDIAVECHLQNVTNHRRLGELLHTGRALDFLGVAYQELGRMTEAIECHRENLEICRELLDVHGTARSKSNLAVTYREAGRLSEAIVCHLDALHTFRTTGPVHREGVELVELGKTYRRAGRYAEAASSWAEALAILDMVPGPGTALAGETRAALAEIEVTAEDPGTQVSERDERTHHLTRARFSRLCAGAVDAETVAMLRDSQHSRRRILLSALFGELDGRVTGAEQAWRILATVDRDAPTVLAEVLMSPLVGVWLVRILRRLRGVATDGPELSVELGLLGSLAGAVAIRGHVPCVLEVPAVDGVVTLPTVGQVRFGTATGPATLTVTPDGVTVSAGGRTCPVPGGPEFFPVRRLEVVAGDLRLDVEVDDSTPYREFSVPLPPRPLDPAELGELAVRVDRAWQVLTRWHPGFAEEIAAGTATLTPRMSSSTVVGSSSPMAFGAVAAATDGSAESLAATLVHEFQHSKLNAVFGLVRLHTDTSASWYVPWRDDPRPLSGVLHGIYAFTSSVEFWAVQRHHVADATFRFAYRRQQVQTTIDVVRHSPNLTGLGGELVDGASRRLDRCAVDDVPAEVTDLIDTVMVEHRAIWRLRHLRPDMSYVDAVVTAWCAQEPAPAAGSLPDMVIPFRRTVSPSARTRLLLAEPHASTGAEFAARVTEEAAAGYVRRLRATPDDGDAWVGLGLTLRATGDTPVARTFLDTPETASTAWQRLVRDVPTPPSPIEFGRWLGGG